MAIDYQYQRQLDFNSLVPPSNPNRQLSAPIRAYLRLFADKKIKKTIACPADCRDRTNSTHHLTRQVGTI
jgi:hypothetical protein